jgi:WD40 repeat protein
MKYLLSSLFISTHLFSMLTVNFSKKSSDDLYAIMETVEQNKLQKNKGLLYVREHLRLYYNEEINISDVLLRIRQRDKTNDQCYLLYKQYLPFYKACIAHILPLDICKQIDCISAQLRNKEFKEMLIQIHVEGTNQNKNLEYHKKPILSDDGHYLTYTLTENNYNLLTFINVETNEAHFQYHNNLYFSPNNEYCVVPALAKHFNSYLYDLRHQQFYSLHHELNSDEQIIISHDSQRFLSKRVRFSSSDQNPLYTLWTLNAQGIPQKTDLKEDIYNSEVALFHPDSKHIIYVQNGTALHAYNLETQEDAIISPQWENFPYCRITSLSLTFDKTKLIAEVHDYNPNQAFYNHPDVAFDIENLTHVKNICLPYDGYGKTVYIPYKKMFAQILKTMLCLYDENMQPVTTHPLQEELEITALAADNTGNYLAVGCSDGSIMIWNVSNSDPEKYEKIFIQSVGPITSLTFNDNKQLLSQSGYRYGREDITYKSTILWDVYGNEIINFGDNVVNISMSPNGKTFAVISHVAEYKEQPNEIYQTLIPTLHLTTYHQTDENLAQYAKQNKELTLTQLSKLIAANNLDQRHLGEQQLTYLPYNQ